MADFPRSNGLELDASLTLDRVEGGETVGTISITTQEDGSLKIASTGHLPSSSLRELRQVREGLQLLVQTTQRDASIEHDGKAIAEVRAHPTKTPKMSVRWLSVIRYGIEKLAGRDRA